ncbi:MAG: recombination protein RecR [Flammeovirgaceae bacterium]|mgnify:FL=1|nr:recombination protein RecR [Flammeovirgaceae bacterium]|tara:strand:- start:1887 stop:2498 length:612 start_codon:yes stop_codon:yes gene_type:complete
MKLPTKILEEAVNEISKLPGIGKKTALRLSLYLLKKDIEFSQNLSKSITDLKEKTQYCDVCHMMCEDNDCVCKKNNPFTNKEIICVVEDTPDVLAIQNTNHYNGLFHVIGGLISPIDGIGPEELNISTLIKRVKQDNVKEIIFALSPTLDGDTTSFYISKKLSEFNVKITTISRGIPIGGEIEYADEVTLGRSISSRINYNLK